jgi:single-strand DNA-binding protein
MKYGINTCTLLGNVGDNPKVQEKDGQPYLASFPFATSDTYRDKNGEEVTKTQWHRILAWGKKAEIAQKYIKKGDPLCIEGSITYNEWRDDNNVKNFKTEIVADNIVLLGSPSQNQQS